MKIVQTYISNLMLVKGSGMAVKETSFYGASEQLLNETGKHLKPVVRAIIHTKNTGSGIPDGGLFTKEQFHKGEESISDFIGQLRDFRKPIEHSSRIDDLRNKV